MANKVEILAEQSSDVALQGDTIRNRVPTGVIIAAGGEVHDAIHWQALTDGTNVWIAGIVEKNAAKGRKATKTVAKKAAKAPKKVAGVHKATTAAKKSTKKSGAVKGRTQKQEVDLDAAFDEEEDWADDAPPQSQVRTLQVPVLARAGSVKPVPLAQRKQSVKTVPARTKGAKYAVPQRR